jgi:hypothetical protein
LVERLCAALARQAEAQRELAASRDDEAQSLAELRALGHDWRQIAARLGAPLAERSCLARRLRQRTWWRDVERLDANRSADVVRPGPPGAPAPPSSQEVHTMNPGRLIKKTVTTTEQTYADGSDLKDADLEVSPSRSWMTPTTTTGPRRPLGGTAGDRLGVPPAPRTEVECLCRRGRRSGDGEDRPPLGRPGRLLDSIGPGVGHDGEPYRPRGQGSQATRSGLAGEARTRGRGDHRRRGVRK